MNSEEEFLKGLAAVTITADPEIEYRLHYNDAGDIVMCSMQSHPDSTQYVVVTAKEYENYFQYQVVKGKLKLIEHDSGVRVAFVPGQSGFKVVRNHAALLLEPNEEYNNIEYYDHRNR